VAVNDGHCYRWRPCVYYCWRIADSRRATLSRDELGDLHLLLQCDDVGLRTLAEISSSFLDCQC